MDITHNKMHLSFSNCMFDTVQVLSTEAKDIEFLSLSMCFADTDGFRNIFQNIRAQEVAVTIAGGSPIMDKSVWNAILGSPRLETLIIRIEDAGAVNQLCRLFENGPPCGNVEQLYLYFHGQIIAPELVIALAGRFPSVRYLTLGMGIMQSEAIIPLQHLKNLEGLSFLGSSLPENAAERLATLPNLRKVDIGYTAVEGGCRRLVKILRDKGVIVVGGTEESGEENGPSAPP